MLVLKITSNDHAGYYSHTGKLVKETKDSVTIKTNTGNMTFPKGEINMKTIKSNTSAVESIVEEKIIDTKTVNDISKKLSKAEQIRSKLRDGASEDEVMEFAIASLKMTKTLAKTYIKNNLSKI